MSEPVSLKQWMKRLRAACDLTQEQLAELVGCAPQTIRMLETGRRRPSRELAERLADVLDVPLAERAQFLRIARTPVSVARVDPVPASLPVSQLQAQLDPQSARLPLPANRLIGRECERTTLVQALSAEGCRLVTLVGPGGIGKTHLAMQVAHDLHNRFTAGALWVALDGCTDIRGFGVALAGALELPPETALATLFDQLAGRKLLLVLDNFEQLLSSHADGLHSKDSGELLKQLQFVAPEVRLLVTSRVRLGLPGEWTIHLEGLGLPATDSPQDVEQAPASRLFLERAQQVDHNFTLTPANAGAVAQICRRLDGVPLAIELAAAWIHTLSAAEIAAELASSLDLLTANDQGRPARHQSLRAVFEQSWCLLAPPERLALGRLARLQGGFTRTAAEQLAGVGLGSLARLIDSSLIRRMADEQQPPRYELYPLVQQSLQAR